MPVMIGVDPHKASHTAAALDEHGRLLDCQRTPATLDGYQQLRQWAGRWPQRRWAVEGAHSVGRALAQRLVLQSQFAALLLVVGASGGGLMASSPDRPGEGERRIDWWAPDQAGQQPAQLGDGERHQHAHGGHRDSPRARWSGR